MVRGEMAGGGGMPRLRAALARDRWPKFAMRQEFIKRAPVPDNPETITKCLFGKKFNAA